MEEAGAIVPAMPDDLRLLDFLIESSWAGEPVARELLELPPEEWEAWAGLRRASLRRDTCRIQVTNCNNDRALDIWDNSFVDEPDLHVKVIEIYLSCF